jgi:transcriptional antiterminator RfaH
MSTHWYAFNSQPLKEDLLWQQLVSRQFECFYPRIRVQVVNPRARRLRPYFPGYLFVRADVKQVGYSTFQYMPYSRGLVAFGGEPAEVPDALILAIRQRIEEVSATGAEVVTKLKSGDTVVIQAGPFAGYEAIFDTCISGTERVRVLLRMLNARYLPIDLRSAQIQKKRSQNS